MGTEEKNGIIDFSPDERRLLLDLARRSLAERAAGTEPCVEEEHFSPALQQRRGCFVTLFNHGELRGCIGHVLPQMPLYKAVARNACNAGFHDPRFEPVSPAEVEELEIEISVLSDVIPLTRGDPESVLLALRAGVDGVLLKHGGMMSTFLPQVWATIPDREEFLSRLCLKAGWDPEAWKDSDVSISTYQVVSFSDSPEG